MKKFSRGLVSNSSQPLKHSFTYPHSLINVPETRVTTLANGLRVATEHSDSETATVGLWIGAGSRFETLRNNGVAHFLEHMTFKGTHKRSRKQIESEIENMGAQLNAYTSREQTVYFSRCLKKDIAGSVDILSDILQNSLLDPKLIEEERHTILREKEEVEKITEEVVFDHLHATAYQGTSLGLTILGSDENIKSIQRNDLLDYIKTHYTSDRMVLVGVGGVDHDALCKLGESAFGNLKKSSISFPSTEFTGSEVRIRDDTQKDAHMVVAVEGVGWTHPDHIPLLVAQTIIGSWDRTLGNGAHLSSKLAQDISGQGLANSFTSFNTTYTDTGLFGIYMIGGDRSKLIELAECTMKNWRRICTSATETEVFRAKNQLKTAMLLGLDSTVNVAEEIGRHLLVYGRRVTPYEIDSMIEAVDVNAVRDVAMKYLYGIDPAVVAHGPIEAWPDYVVLKSNMTDPLF
jgi:processing peptidase subunit beta